MAELDAALDQLQALLVPGGVLVVVEWAWERFDEATAQWSSDRAGIARPRGRTWLAAQAPGAMGRLGEALGRLPAGLWATEEGLHPAEAILRSLDARFDRRFHAESPYYFADLADTSEAQEQAAIDTGQIRAGGIRYAATRP